MRNMCFFIMDCSLTEIFCKNFAVEFSVATHRAVSIFLGQKKDVVVGHGLCVKDAHSNGYFYTLILLQFKSTMVKGKTSLDVTRLPTIKLNLYWLKELD